VQKLIFDRRLAYGSNDLAAPPFIQQLREFAISMGELLHSGDVHRKLVVVKGSDLILGHYESPSRIDTNACCT
jgi:hypothetical protein